METAKVRVKFGSLEVEYEGNQAFVSDGLLSLVTEVVDLSANLPDAPEVAIATETSAASDNGGVGVGSLSMSTIAAHLQPESQQDLIMCTLAKLQVIDGKGQVDKADILDEMKRATGYFRAAMTSNFARDLKRMVKGQKINEVASGVYSLTAANRQELESKLANIG